MRQLLIIAGLPGVGKTTAASFFQSQQIPVIRMGKLTDEVLKNQGKKLNEINEKYWREKLRLKFGKEVYAKYAFSKILEKYKKHPLVVIEGLRTQAEYEYFRKKLPNIKILFLEADRLTRSKRLLLRKDRSLKGRQLAKRDKIEKKIGLMDIRKLADFVIDNKNDIKAFNKDLLGLLKKIKKHD